MQTNVTQKLIESNVFVVDIPEISENRNDLQIDAEQLEKIRSSIKQEKNFSRVSSKVQFMDKMQGNGENLVDNYEFSVTPNYVIDDFFYPSSIVDSFRLQIGEKEHHVFDIEQDLGKHSSHETITFNATLEPHKIVQARKLVNLNAMQYSPMEVASFLNATTLHSINNHKLFKIESAEKGSSKTWKSIPNLSSYSSGLLSSSFLVYKVPFSFFSYLHGMKTNGEFIDSSTLESLYYTTAPVTSFDKDFIEQKWGRFAFDASDLKSCDDRVPIVNKPVAFIAYPLHANESNQPSRIQVHPLVQAVGGVQTLSTVANHLVDQAIDSRTLYKSYIRDIALEFSSNYSRVIGNQCDVNLFMNKESLQASDNVLPTLNQSLVFNFTTLRPMYHEPRYMLNQENCKKLFEEYDKILLVERIDYSNNDNVQYVLKTYFNKQSALNELYYLELLKDTGVSPIVLNNEIIDGAKVIGMSKCYHLCMTYEGMDLASFLQRYSKMPTIQESLMMRIAYDMFHTVKVLRQNQVVHMDIRTNHFLINETTLNDIEAGSPLTDEVLSIVDYEYMTNEGTLLFVENIPQDSPYLAPECYDFLQSQSEGDSVVGRSLKVTKYMDSWALGLSLLEIFLEFDPQEFSRQQIREMILYKKWSQFKYRFAYTPKHFHIILYIIENLLLPIPEDRISIEDSLTLLKTVLSKMESKQAEEEVSDAETAESEDQEVEIIEPGLILSFEDERIWNDEEQIEGPTFSEPTPTTFIPLTQRMASLGISSPPPPSLQDWPQKFTPTQSSLSKLLEKESLEQAILARKQAIMITQVAHEREMSKITPQLQSAVSRFSPSK